MGGHEERGIFALGCAMGGRERCLFVTNGRLWGAKREGFLRLAAPWEGGRGASLKTNERVWREKCLKSLGGTKREGFLCLAAPWEGGRGEICVYRAGFKLFGNQRIIMCIIQCIDCVVCPDLTLVPLKSDYFNGGDYQNF